MKNTVKDTDIKIQQKLQEKKLCQTNQSTSFREDSFSNAPNSKLGMKGNPNILKDGFSSGADPLILRPRVPKSFKQLNKTTSVLNIQISKLLVTH